MDILLGINCDAAAGGAGTALGTPRGGGGGGGGTPRGRGGIDGEPPNEFLLLGVGISDISTWSNWFLVRISWTLLSSSGVVSCPVTPRCGGGVTTTGVVLGATTRLAVSVS